MYDPHGPATSDESGALRLTLASTISGSDESVALRVLEAALWPPRDGREQIWLLLRLTRNEQKELAIMAAFIVNDVVLRQLWKAALVERARLRAAKEGSVADRLRQPRPVLRVIRSDEDTSTA